MTERAAPVVEVEAWLAHLIPTFLANRLKDADRLRRALRERDFDAIRALGHNLRGAAGGYGFAALAEVGERIEAAAIAGDADGAAACSDELAAYARTVKVVYR